MTNNMFITIGKIVAPHGVRGDVRVVPHTDFPERFLNLKSVKLENGPELVIESARFHKQFILLKFKGYDDRNAIESFRGRLLQIDKDDVMPLPEGHYYIFDIIGLSVYTEDDCCIGMVTDVLETGSNDVYVVEQEGKKPLMVPALKEVIKKIDIDNKKMIVKLQEEWD